MIRRHREVMPGGLFGRDHLQLLRNRGIGVASCRDRIARLGVVHVRRRGALGCGWSVAVTPPRFRRRYGLLR